MISYYVLSLFTKVDVGITLDFLSRKLQQCQDLLPLPHNVIIELIKLCTDDNVFTYGDRFYRQTFGCSMGSPLSPVLSNLFMEYFESELLSNVIDENTPWMRYVDDIFSVCSLSDEQFNVFFERLNSLCPSIKFQIEWESNNKLSFLDIQLVRQENQVFYKVFRKPTHSNMYIHYFSYHKETIKLAVLSSLFLRAYRICSPCFF